MTNEQYFHIDILTIFLIIYIISTTLWILNISNRLKKLEDKRRIIIEAKIDELNLWENYKDECDYKIKELKKELFELDKT